MSRKAKSGKALSAKELVGIMSDTIRNVKNGTIDVEHANAISGATRTLCAVVKPQIAASKYIKENPEGAENLLN